MATVILQAAGAALGGLFGSTGAAIGTAAGALAGYALDRALLGGGERRVEGPRLSAQRLFTAEEGAALPLVYGSARVGGTLIWATRFEEKRQTKRQGGKGGGSARVTEYRYVANAAFALCEGPIAGVRRVWADGVELDLAQVELRVHRGTETQEPDPLILLKQGGEAPAYRGTAYAVLERLPIGEFGNRLPQLQFEVLRPVGRLHEQVRAVCLIPGATEYGLSPELVTREKREGDTEALNRHVLHAGTDLEASLDELQALCPNLEHVAVVATWFGDDLRAGACRIRPAVTDNAASGFSEAWTVSGVSRASAAEVSRHGGGAAYGGTPSDRSVVAAIREIRQRGLKATLYPFVMMDVPAGNGLPDPYGGAEQGAYPWRGRITVAPAPGRPGSPDKTAAARSAVEAFCGAAEIGDFAPGGDAVGWQGGAGEWGYRRLVLHYAHLAAAAGGVDAFLIGSELRGLSTLRDETGAFPFVDELCRLAADARAVLGATTKITYGADWSEYFGYQPADGSGDRLFHLDALWAHPAIDAVGIDNYMPLTDWRDADHGGGHPDGARGPSDPEALRAAIAGGEGFDWFHDGQAARERRERTPITDGGYGKPWVFRFKDIRGWWENPHFDCVGGVESPTPTPWVPCSKPVWFTELGCPAADKGGNQPNVFPDPKSAEGAAPYFSNGGRSDLAQRRFLEAHLAWWDENDERFAEGANPVSPLAGVRMVDRERIYLWAWDARPFPAFPLREDRWADGSNWLSGHWLNGRLEAPALGDLFNAVLAARGLPPAKVDGVEGSVGGYVVEPGSARDAIEPLLELFGVSAVEEPEGLAFRSDGALPTVAADPGAFVLDGNGAVMQRVREPDHALPAEHLLGFVDALAGYGGGSARAVRFGASGKRREESTLPVVLDPGQAEALSADRLRRRWGGREEVRFALAPETEVEPGMLLNLPGGSEPFLVTEVEKGLTRAVVARQRPRTVPSAWHAAKRSRSPLAAPLPLAGQPLMLLLDLPLGITGAAEGGFRAAFWQKPWRPQGLWASPGTLGFELRATAEHAANVGRLLAPLAPGFSGRIDRGGSLLVELFDGEALSVDRLRLLGGANALAVQSTGGGWEVLQFGTAEEIAPQVFRLGELLRGQIGTEDCAEAGAPAGAFAVILDDAVVPAGLRAGEAGLILRWRGGPVGLDFSDRFFETREEAGGVRARLPLRPVHLRLERTDGGAVRFRWMRRSRVDADAWEPDDVPLGEEREEYFVELAAPDGLVVRRVVVPEPSWLWEAAAVAADFGAPPVAVELRVRQRGTGIGWGLEARKRLVLPPPG